MPDHSMAHATADAFGRRKKRKKVAKVMGEFKRGNLHSGRNGPVVMDKKQAIAIAMSEAHRKG